MTAVVPPPTPPAPQPAAAPGPARAAAPGPSPWPTPAEWLDLVGLGLLIGLGLYGFQTAYGGSRYLIAGLVGTLLGLGVALWGARTRQPLIVMAAVTVGVYFLFGGPVAVPDRAIAGVLPSPGSVLALVDGTINGWAKLLTADPPVGTRDNLLVVPYLCGLVAAVVALTIARRTRRGQLAVLAPLAVLALSILFGTPLPASLLLQGAVFGVVAIGWVSLHRRQSRRIDVGPGRVGRSDRLPATVAVLVLAGLVALLAGSAIPGAGTRPRVVLRNQTEPPFDPRNHPSPLSSFRRYSGGIGEQADPQLRDTTLFAVKGLTAGERVRLATMDGYDGEVFTVGSGPGSSGWFQRVGDQPPHPPRGERRKVSVTVAGYSDIWVPGAGYLDAVAFGGPRADRLRDGFRYNESTGTAASTMRLAKGDRITMEVVLPPRGGTGNAEKVDQPDVAMLPAAASTAKAWQDEWVAANKGEKLTSLALVRDVLVRDGVDEEGASVGVGGSLPDEPARPGHHLGRLDDMVREGGRMVGDGEQYAPLVALMSRDLGVPARVVMGFVVPEGHDDRDEAVAIKGGDVDAWVEVAIDGSGWVPVKIDPQNTDPKVQEEKTDGQSAPPPPPPPTIPPTEDDDVDANKVDSRCGPGGSDAARGDSGAAPGSGGESASGEKCPPVPPGDNWILKVVLAVTGVAMLPFAVIGAITAVIAGMKSRRRNRRRRSGPPSTRVAGGWHEVIDLAADMGSPIPVLATRSEGARLVGMDAAAALARHADVGIFGPTDLTDEWVDRYWSDVDHTRAAMTADMSRVQRWRVLVSLASLRSSFDRWRLGFRRARAGSDPDAADGGRVDDPGPIVPAEATVGVGASSVDGAWYQGASGGDRGTVGTDHAATHGRTPVDGGPDGGSWWREEGE